MAPPPPPLSPPTSPTSAIFQALYGVAAAAAAAYTSPPRAQGAPPDAQRPRQPQSPEQQWQRAASPPPPRAPPPPQQQQQQQPRPQPDRQNDAPTNSPFALGPLPAALLAAFYDAALRLALKLSGLSDAVWARAAASASGAAAPLLRPSTSSSSVSAPRLALALNGALARLARSSQACLGVSYLKPSLREIATFVRAVEAEAEAGRAAAAAAAAPPGPFLSRPDADAALALCVRHSLPPFARAFWRRYAVPAAMGALAVGLARDLLLPLLLLLLRPVLWSHQLSLLRLVGSAALLSPLSPFVSGPLLGVAAACGAQVHGDPLWALRRGAAWTGERAAAFVGGGGGGGGAPASSSSSFGDAGAGDSAADAGWADGAADVDMVDELLAEASAYLDALQRQKRGGASSGDAASTSASGASAAAADLGARVLTALRHRRRG